MSSTGDTDSANTSSNVEKCTPKIVRHLRSILLELKCGAEKMEIGQFIKSPVIPVQGIKGNAVFKIQRTSEEVMSVSCCILSEIKDDGYFLRLYFHVMGVKEKTKRAEIRFPDTSATVEYKAASFSKSLIKENEFCCLKCVLRLIETSYLSRERRVSLDRQFQDAINRYSKFDGLLKDMSYIVGRHSLNYMFTGRETEKEALEKTVYIKRAFDYVKVLVGYFVARDIPRSRVRKIPIGEILGHIFLGKKTISVKDCVWFFLRVNRLGLIFLKTLCTEYILANLSNDVVLDALIAADEVEDGFLFEAASHCFIENRQEILQSSRWIKPGEEQYVFVRSILHHMHLQIHFPRILSVPQLEDETSEEE